MSFVGGPASAFLSGADGCADFAGEVAVVVTSPAVLACWVVAADLADTRMAFPADPAVVVTVAVASLAVVGMVTVGVADLADAGMAFPADPAGVATVGVTDLADARAASLADIAGVVTVGVASLADAGLVTVGMTDLADARAASLAALVVMLLAV